MKRKVFRKIGLALLLLVLAADFVLAGGGGEKKAKKLVLGVSMPTKREMVWVKGADVVAEGAAGMGVEARVVYADGNVADQVSQIENLLSQGIDALIIAPVDSEALASTLDKVHAEGVAVVVLGRPVNNCYVDYFVSSDNFGIGAIMGKYLVEHIPEGSNIIVMSGAPTDGLSAIYKAGAMSAINPLVHQGKLHIVAEQAVDNWLPENAMRIVENALTQSKNNIQGILAPNDNTAGGSIQALEAQGLVGKVVVTGLDAEISACKRILAGQQSMTVFRNLSTGATHALNAAVKLARGEKDLNVNAVYPNGKMDVPTYNDAPVLITKDNLIQALVDEGFYTEGELK
jgi:D-xylose transport system substrate-binding protein